MNHSIPFFLFLFLSCTRLQAQHEHHGNNMNDSATMKPKVDTVPLHHGTHHMEMETDDNMSMSHAFSRNLPMTRNGSGTSWLPDNSPMYAYMFHSKKWMYMLHGDMYIRYNKQDLFDKGIRGDHK